MASAVTTAAVTPNLLSSFTFIALASLAQRASTRVEISRAEYRRATMGGPSRVRRDVVNENFSRQLSCARNVGRALQASSVCARGGSGARRIVMKGYNVA